MTVNIFANNDSRCLCVTLKRSGSGDQVCDCSQSNFGPFAQIKSMLKSAICRLCAALDLVPQASYCAARVTLLGCGIASWGPPCGHPLALACIPHCRAHAHELREVSNPPGAVSIQASACHSSQALYAALHMRPIGMSSAKLL